MINKLLTTLLLCTLYIGVASAQPDYSDPAQYEIGNVVVNGAKYSDDNTIIAIAGFKVGQVIQVPGNEIPRAMKALWKLRLFSDVEINIAKKIGDVIILEINVVERPRLTRYDFKNIRKSREDDLKDIVRPFLLKGGIVNQDVLTNAKNAVKKYYIEKGYLDVDVNISEVTDENIDNGIRLEFDIDKKKKVKIQNITFSGNDNIKARKLRKKMEDTHRKWKIFSGSKLQEKEYKSDKRNIITYYNNSGYRDARITSDSIWREDDGDLRIHINIDEGNRYYFRSIAFKGNSIYDDELLERALGIGKGDVYDQALLDTRLNFSPDGRDVSSLYMDNGYLFFQIDPVEIAVVNDSIDLEIRIFEGPQATIGAVKIAGNDRTHEHVIRRELRTLPGKKFSRSDIIRSQRQIINLGYFDPENLGINTPVNPQRGTVDIEYSLAEKSSDQLELSAGWGGAGRGVIGTLGVTFNNFSLNNMFKKEAWKPLPQGDGQRLSVRAQTNGKFFQSYNLSLTEPWLGGKKPNSFTVGVFYSRFTNGADRATSTFQSLDNLGLTIGLGTQLKWPDDYFISQTSLSIQSYALDNWARGGFRDDNGDLVTDGRYNNFAIIQNITRSSIDAPIFPTSGSRISLKVQLTPPYSLFRKSDNFEDLPNQERYRFLEYHKWNFTAEWYKEIIGKLVVKVGAKVGILGYYNEDIGLSPFERFEVGGDGLSNQFIGIAGREIYALRGYEVSDLPANNNGGASVFNKYTVELRYPLTTNPNSTVYVLSFFEGGNAWTGLDNFNPFDLRRSAGVGVRVFLPMFGTLGFDYGFGFDKPNVPVGSKWTEYGRFSIILGFEPQ